MTDTEELKSDLHNCLTLHHNIHMFAMTSLSEDNPFRPLIEKQTRVSVDEIRAALGQIDDRCSRNLC